MNALIRDISHNRSSMALAIFCSLVLTAITFLLQKEFLPSDQPFNELWGTFEGWKSNLQRGVILNYLFVLTSAWSLFKINETYALSHTRTYLPFWVYIILQITNPGLQFISEGTLAALTVIPSIFLLFQSYQREKASEFGFLIGLIFGSLTLFWLKGIYYMPFFILGFWFMRCLSFKVLLASVIGFIIPLWLQFAWKFFNNETISFIYQFQPIAQFELPKLTQIPLYLQINGGVTLLTGIVASVYLLITNFQEKVRTQAYFNFLILLSLISAILCLLDLNNLSGHLTILYLSVTFLASNIFIKVQTKAVTFLFLMITAAYLAAFVLNLWIN